MYRMWYFINSVILYVGLCLLPIYSLAQTPPSLPSAYNSALKVNYVRSWEVIKPLTVADSIKTSTGVATARMMTQYLDGLGRPVQAVIKGGSLVTDSTNLITSTGARDMISATEYDPFGREVYQYLPFAGDTIGLSIANNGLFKVNPFQQQVALKVYESTLTWYSRPLGDFNRQTFSVAITTVPTK